MQFNLGIFDIISVSFEVGSIWMQCNAILPELGAEVKLELVNADADKIAFD